MILIPLIYLSILDLKYREINNVGLIVLLLTTIFSSLYNIHIFMAIMVFVFIILTFSFIQQWIGGGDLKIISILIIHFGIEIITVIFWATLFAMAFHLINRSIKYIPFVPFITLGVLIVKI